MWYLYTMEFYAAMKKLTLSASSQAIWVRATGGPGALLVSAFNVKWRSAPAGGVEGSKFCLFLVILPAKCVSSVSPRFHYRMLTFCFLPLAAILDSFSMFCCDSVFNIWILVHIKVCKFAFYLSQMMLIFLQWGVCAELFSIFWFVLLLLSFKYHLNILIKNF
jgi:hypothetical protein